MRFTPCSGQFVRGTLAVMVQWCWKKFRWRQVNSAKSWALYSRPRAGLCLPAPTAAGRGSGYGGGQAWTGPMGLIKLEIAGFEALFEGGERGGEHGRAYNEIRPVLLPETLPKGSLASANIFILRQFQEFKGQSPSSTTSIASKCAENSLFSVFRRVSLVS
jgi:hypothetical protein